MTPAAPWHLHGHPVLVLSRNGTPSSGSPLWMDTFDVRPGEVWEVAFRATNPEIWMNHCHNLPHANQGMMLRLRCGCGCGGDGDGDGDGDELIVWLLGRGAKTSSELG